MSLAFGPVSDSVLRSGSPGGLCGTLTIVEFGVVVLVVAVGANRAVVVVSTGVTAVVVGSRRGKGSGRLVEVIDAASLIVVVVGNRRGVGSGRVVVVTEAEARVVVELVVVAVLTGIVVVVDVTVEGGVTFSNGLDVSICSSSARAVLALLPSTSVAVPVTDHVPSTSSGNTHPVLVGVAMY